MATVKVSMKKYPTFVVEDPVSPNYEPEKESDPSWNPKTSLHRRSSIEMNIRNQNYSSKPGTKALSIKLR